MLYCKRGDKIRMAPFTASFAFDWFWAMHDASWLMIFSLFILQKNEISNHYVLCSRWGFLFVRLLPLPRSRPVFLEVPASRQLCSVAFCHILSSFQWTFIGVDRLWRITVHWSTQYLPLVVPCLSLHNPLCKTLNLNTNWKWLINDRKE